MNKVKYYRLISGLLLKDLSEKTGLSVGHLSHIENGNKQPSKQKTLLYLRSCCYPTFIYYRFYVF